MIQETLHDFSENSQPVISNPPIKIKENKQSPLLSYSGIALLRELIKKLGVEESLNTKVSVFKRHKPYFESDHILNLTYNFLTGGEVIHDLNRLRNDEGFLRLLGAETLPAPTTAGDFLVRFSEDDIKSFDAALNEIQDKAFMHLPKRKKKIATIDTDSSIHEVYGDKKEGADFAYTNQWSYNVLYFTLMETGDVLDIILREGNTYSSKGTADKLGPLFKRMSKHFKKLRYRGDSAFYDKKIITECEENAVEFYITADQTKPIMNTIFNIPEARWKPCKKQRKKGIKRRKKRKNLKKKIIKERISNPTSKGKSQIADFWYNPSGWGKEYRFIVKRTEIMDENGQQYLDETLCKYTYHIIVTNSDLDNFKTMKIAQGRGNQENLIKDFKHGLGLSHVPTGFLNANIIYFKIAGLAWNLKTWMLNLTGLGDGAVIRFKRFLYQFIYIAANVAKTARDHIVLRLQKGLYYSCFSKAMGLIRSI